MKTVKLHQVSSPSAVVTVRYCDSFLSKFIGLMFSKRLEEDRGLILVGKNESRVNSAIHMLFVNYDIAVFWLDSRMVVVDKVLAKKWHLVYCPQHPAKYIAELHSSKFSEYELGEKMEILSV